MKYVSDFVGSIFLSKKERSWIEEVAECDTDLKGKCVILLWRMMFNGILIGIWVGIAFFLTAASFAMVASGYV